MCVHPFIKAGRRTDPVGFQWMKDGAGRYPRVTINPVVRLNIRDMPCPSASECMHFLLLEKLSSHPNDFANDLKVITRREKVCPYGYAGMGRASAAQTASVTEKKCSSQ
jgi:hypothetical protein